MRLLHSQTLTFKNFANDDERPKYAILSHTWGDEEVSYQDMIIPNSDASNKAGYTKIQHAAIQALQSNIEWIWVDTCNIDTSSSSELSEAITSMYSWYGNSEVCYAYLSDVGSERSQWHKQFQSSRLA